MKLCFRCYNYDYPLRQYNQNAGVWYLGCSRCGVVFSSIETFMKISVEYFENFLENFFEKTSSVDDRLLYFFLKRLNRDWKASKHYNDSVPWYDGIVSYPSSELSNTLFNGLDYSETVMLKECISNSPTFRKMIREFDELMQL